MEVDSKVCASNAGNLFRDVARAPNGPLGSIMSHALSLDISPFGFCINISMIGEVTNALHRILDKA